MKKPDINKIWETAIRIPNNEIFTHLEILVKDVIPTISLLKNKCKVKWYCFSRHDNINGIPIPNHDGDQFHIKFENSANLLNEELIKEIPNHFEQPSKINPIKLRAISGINENLLKNEDLLIARKLIGEECEWIVKLIKSHKWTSDSFTSTNNRELIQNNLRQIRQFQHYIRNITQLEII